MGASGVPSGANPPECPQGPLKSCITVFMVDLRFCCFHGYLYSSVHEHVCAIIPRTLFVP